MKFYRVIENDRMFNKQRTIAAKLDVEAANWIQTMRYNAKIDPWIQYLVEAEIARKWGDDV